MSAPGDSAPLPLTSMADNPNRAMEATLMLMMCFVFTLLKGMMCGC